MADFTRARAARATRESQERDQNAAKENFERNLPAWIRDGKEIEVTFDAGIALTVEHGLDRVPKGWVLTSHGGPVGSDGTKGGSPYAISEVLRDKNKIRLINNYGGASTVTAKLWIW